MALIHTCHYAYVTSCHREKKNTTVGVIAGGRAFHETTKKMSESHNIVRLLWMYFPWNWEFGSALSKLRNFGREVEYLKPAPSVRHWLALKQFSRHFVLGHKRSIFLSLICL
jgi:hypothetical protein